MALLNRQVEYKFNPVVDKTLSGDREERLNRVFQALSDPSRRTIVELLRQSDELKVGDVAEAFAMTLNGVSKHLKVLERAGIVVREVRGREHWLRIEWSALQSPYEWLHFYHHYLSQRLDALVDYVTQDKKREEP